MSRPRRPVRAPRFDRMPDDGSGPSIGWHIEGQSWMRLRSGAHQAQAAATPVLAKSEPSAWSFWIRAWRRATSLLSAAASASSTSARARRTMRVASATARWGLGRRSGCDGRGYEAAAFSHAARGVPVASVRPACLTGSFGAVLASSGCRSSLASPQPPRAGREPESAQPGREDSRSIPHEAA
jgi:hypothetical protein